MPKLFNTIIIYDVYTWAENAEDARAAAVANIRDAEAPLQPSEETALDVGRQGIRAAWLNEKPLVGAAVSDVDFERVRGKTCEQLWNELNKKPETEKSNAKAQAQAAK